MICSYSPITEIQKRLSWLNIRYYDAIKQQRPMLVEPIFVSHKVPNKSIIGMMTSFKWKHFPRYWPFLRGIHWSPVNSPHKDRWRGALMFSLICAWINGWVNNGEAGDLGRHRAHYYVIAMLQDNQIKAWAGVRCNQWPLLLTWFNFNPSMDK